MKEQNPGRSSGGEFYIERDQVTPESLIEDNRSPEAELRRRKWEENRANKSLTLLNTCSDARIVTPHPTSSVVVRSVAAGEDLVPFAKLIGHKSIDNVHIMGHHAGNSVVEGDHPHGCGGLGVKASLKDRLPNSVFEEWVEGHVNDADCLLHAFFKAADVLEYTDKDILLSTQDHLDHTIIPMSGFIQGRMVGPINYEDFSEYQSEDVYKSGIPIIPNEDLEGSSFERYLGRYFTQQLPTLLGSFAEHDRTTQETQTPRMLLLTTNIRPPEVNYPNLTRNPNTVFVATLARTKVNDQLHITDEDIESVLAQSEIAILHYNRRLTTVYIETGDMKQSVKIARAFEARKPFVPWMEGKGNQVLLGESKAGKILDIQKF